MALAGDLVQGRVYFSISYPDEAMLYPCVQSYVYLGVNVLGGAGKDPRHFFQTVESYHEVGSWVSMSPEERDKLGPDKVILIEGNDVDLISDTSEFIEFLADYRNRASGSGS